MNSDGVILHRKRVIEQYHQTRTMRVSREHTVIYNKHVYNRTKNKYSKTGEEVRAQASVVTNEHKTVNGL